VGHFTQGKARQKPGEVRATEEEIRGSEQKQMEKECKVGAASIWKASQTRMFISDLGGKKPKGLEWENRCGRPSDCQEKGEKDTADKEGTRITWCVQG